MPLLLSDDREAPPLLLPLLPAVAPTAGASPPVGSAAPASGPAPASPHAAGAPHDAGAPIPPHPPHGPTAASPDLKDSPLTPASSTTPIPSHAAPAPRSPTRYRGSNDLFDEAPPPPGDRPRPPDVFLDPRTLFKRTPLKPPPRAPSPRPAPPPRVPAADAPRYDLLIAPRAPAFRTSDAGIQALLRYLMATQLFVFTHESHDDAEHRVDLAPDACCHHAFLVGEAPSGPPCVAAATLRTSPVPFPLPWGDPTRTTHLALLLLGARFPAPLPEFLARLDQILLLRPVLWSTPHDPERLF